MPLLMQLLIGTSIRRYAPPIGTAGFARCLVRGYNLLPAPPPRITAAREHVTQERLSQADSPFVTCPELLLCR